MLPDVLQNILTGLFVLDRARVGFDLKLPFGLDRAAQLMDAGVLDVGADVAALGVGPVMN